MSIAYGRIASFVTLVLLLPGIAYPQQVDVHTLIDDAVVAGQWQQVIELLEPRLAEAPDEAVSYWYGVARYESGDPGGAVGHLNRALELNPDSIPTVRYLSRCAADLADSDTAVALAKRFPTDAQITFGAGKALMQEYYRTSIRDRSGLPFHQMDAVKWFRTSTLIDGESAETYRWLAFAYKDGYAWARALASINQAIALGPAGWEAHSLAGECYGKLDAHEQAAQAYLRASELAPQPHRADLLFKQGEMLNNAGLYREAIEAYKRVMVLDFGHRVVRYRLGEAALNAKDYYLALWSFKESREVDGNIDSLFGVGRCQYELGNHEDAERLISQAIEETKSHGLSNPVKWRHYLGRAQLRLGKFQEANEALVKAFNARPGDLIYARWAFKSYMMTDDPYGAIEVCEKIADQGYPDVAMEGIKHVMKTWPRPRFRDLRAGQRRPHTDVAAMVMAKIAYRAQRFRAAVGMYRMLGRLEGRRPHLDAGWARLAADDMDGALISFRDFSQHTKPEWRDYGYLGGATTLILQGKAEDADKALSMIEHPFLKQARAVCKLWGYAATGREVKRGQADPFTMLGIVGWEFVDRQGDTGLEIRAILPGSLLDQSPVKVRPMDVLTRVYYHKVDSFQRLYDLRKESLLDRPVMVTIRRGSREFEVEVDFADALTKLIQPDKSDDPDAVEQGGDD